LRRRKKMRTKNNSSSPRSQKRYYLSRKKYCAFCKDRIALVDYKNVKLLENFISETGKIFPSRMTGTCSYHQKLLTKAIKRSRIMALLKFVEEKRG
jgi:small subunit ribosomal protein S18